MLTPVSFNQQPRKNINFGMAFRIRTSGIYGCSGKLKDIAESVEKSKKFDVVKLSEGGWCQLMDYNKPSLTIKYKDNVDGFIDSTEKVKSLSKAELEERQKSLKKESEGAKIIKENFDLHDNNITLDPGDEEKYINHGLGLFNKIVEKTAQKEKTTKQLDQIM